MDRFSDTIEAPEPPEIDYIGLADEIIGGNVLTCFDWPDVATAYINNLKHYSDDDIYISLLSHPGVPEALAELMAKQDATQNDAAQVIAKAIFQHIDLDCLELYDEAKELVVIWAEDQEVDDERDDDELAAELSDSLEAELKKAWGIN